MLGALIGAGASLLGGVLGQRSSESAADRAAAAAHAANQTQLRIADRNVQQQRQFARMGIRWRVADAEAAGIHPLAALGANTMSFNPVSVGTTTPGYYGGDNALGNGIAQAGQNLGRAIAAQQTEYERAMQVLTLQRAGLENQLLESQIARTNGAQVGPPMPMGQRYLIDGQTGSGMLVSDQPLTRTNSQPGEPWHEPGALADVGYVRTADGGYAVVPSNDAKQRIEDMVIPEIMWSVRNNLKPMFGANFSPPFAAPPNKEWQFTGDAYYLVPRRYGATGSW